MMKKFLLLVLIAWVAGLPVFSLEVDRSLEKVLDLNELIRNALDNNTMLTAAELSVLAAEQAVFQAGTLPDPRLTLGMMNLPVNSFALDQEPMTGKQIQLMQTFPFPGKQALSSEIAELEAAAVKFQELETRNHVVFLVKRFYYDLYAVDRALETVEKNRGLFEQFVQAAEIKYSTGSGLQQDVLRAQVEISKLEDHLLMWRQKRRTLESGLNALLNRDPGYPIDPVSPALMLPDPNVGQYTNEEIERNRPLLKVRGEKIRKAQAAVKLAHKMIWPDLTVGAGYSQRNDLKSGMIMHDFFSATVSLNIPLFHKRKQQAAAAQKELDLAVVEAEYKNLRSGVLAEADSLQAAMERSRKRIQLYQGGILIQAQQALDSAFSGYQVGKVDFLTLLSNWTMLFNYELEVHFALSEYHKSLAAYEFAAGERIKTTGAETPEKELRPAVGSTGGGYEK